MCLLAIETATASGSFAILKEDRIVFQDFADLKRAHSETIMVRIDNALKSLKIDKADLKGICVSNGPGSFTGLRIGLATAKGMATGLKIPLVAFNTLQTLATNVYGTDKHVLSVLDARMNEAYVAVFDHDLNVVSDSHCRKYGDIAKGLDAKNGYICVGAVDLIDGFPSVKFALPHQNLLSAASQFSLLKLKNIKLEYDEDFIYNLEPYYVRSADSQGKKL